MAKRTEGMGGLATRQEEEVLPLPPSNQPARTSAGGEKTVHLLTGRGKEGLPLLYLAFFYLNLTTLWPAFSLLSSQSYYTQRYPGYNFRYMESGEEEEEETGDDGLDNTCIYVS